MKNSEAMIIVLKQLENILVTDKGNIDALNELITEYNYYSAHHIIPKRNKKYGVTKPSNIIPLSAITHPQFNFIEQCNYKMAQEINDGFIELKETKNGLIIAQLKILKDDLLNKYGYDYGRTKKRK